MTWDECKPFASSIRAAVKAGLPPKQVLFNDPSHTTYDEWDLKLIKAHQFSEDFSVDGIPAWWVQSEKVFYDVERKINRAQAAKERAEKTDSERESTKDVPGRFYVPVPVTRDGTPLPTFREWIEEMQAKAPKK